MFRSIVITAVILFSLPVMSNDDDKCIETVLAPTGFVRDGFDTTSWIDSIFWVNNLKQTVDAEDRNLRTFSCDTAFVDIVGQPTRAGDFAVFQNTFGFDLNDFPDTLAQFEFTLRVDSLVNSYENGDSFTLFRVYQDENDLSTVMLNVDLIRIKSFTKPDTKPVAGDYWLMEISFINQKDGSTYIKYHAIKGDEADVYYRWEGDNKMANTYMIITDEKGAARYDSKVPDVSSVKPRINHLGMVDAATPFVIGDQIVLHGPMPRNQ
ncbi:hypothetical protein ACFODZ_00365 [Marinicella sediminis]|uniref:PEP-CTERM sorting domain-containing protein n=1 Tax=Marinicella sediminis TaxID=1792834 RepID=A0ABV7J3R4_9GAMM|nr:hypothetical protein [Marinicella sediminis]